MFYDFVNPPKGKKAAEGMANISSSLLIHNASLRS